MNRNEKERIGTNRSEGSESILMEYEWISWINWKEIDYSNKKIFE